MYTKSFTIRHGGLEVVHSTEVLNASSLMHTILIKWLAAKNEHAYNLCKPHQEAALMYVSQS